MKKLLVLVVVAAALGTIAAGVSVWLTYAGVEETFVDYVVEGGRKSI